MIGLLGAIFTIVAAGFGVTMLLARRRLNLWECIALPWLLGTGFVSLTLWLCGFVLRGFVLQLIVGALCLLLGAIGFNQWRKLPRCAPEKLEPIFIGLFVVDLVLVVWLSLQHTLGWDGLTVWELKARYAFLNGGVMPVAYFSDTARWFSHPEYPLLLPLTETWVYLWIGDCDQFLIKLIFPIWYAAAMSILLLAAEDLSGRRWLGWILVLLFPLVPCIHNTPGGIQVGYADLPLAAIYLGAVFYLLRFMRDGARDSLALFIALAAALPWMKREGAILWLVISIAGTMSILRRRNISTAALSVLPGIGVLAIWKIFLVSVHALPSRDFISINAAGFENLERVRGMFQELWLQLSDRGTWDIFWLLVLVALIAAIVRARNERIAALLWLLFAPLVCYCASYIFSAWPNYIAHVETSLPRLLIQLTPIGWLLIALALGPNRVQANSNTGD